MVFTRISDLQCFIVHIPDVGYYVPSNLILNPKYMNERAWRKNVKLNRYNEYPCQIVNWHSFIDLITLQH